MKNKPIKLDTITLCTISPDRQCLEVRPCTCKFTVTKHRLQHFKTGNCQLVFPGRVESIKKS